MIMVMMKIPEAVQVQEVARVIVEPQVLVVEAVQVEEVVRVHPGRIHIQNNMWEVRPCIQNVQPVGKRLVQRMSIQKK